MYNMGNKFVKTNLEPFDDEDDGNLERLLAISERLVETDETFVVQKRKAKPVKGSTCTYTNAFLKHAPDVTVWIRTPQTKGEARVISVMPSPHTIGWLVVDCFTRKERFHLEVTANWPMLLRLQYP